MSMYILDEHGKPMRCEDMRVWADWMAAGDRIVAKTDVGELRVSTVFLGLDHNFDFGHGPPVLWETMIFGAPAGSPLAGYQKRYTGQQAAVEGHAQAVVLALAAKRD